MPAECARVKASFIVEGEHIERSPNDANRLAAKKLNDNLGHAHPMPGEDWKVVACPIPQHLLELGVRQAIQPVILVEQKPAT
jgi:hypothetical protein